MFCIYTCFVFFGRVVGVDGKNISINRMEVNMFLNEGVSCQS